MTQRFYKVQASGNDFLLLDKRKKSERVNWYKNFARTFCERKISVGADGVLVAERKNNKLKMRIFNADGSEAEMCGNGARAFALWLNEKKKYSSTDIFTFTTKAGEISAKVINGIPQIRLNDPTALKRGVPIKIDGQLRHIDTINTGVPHAVVFVEKVDDIDVAVIGGKIRHHRCFTPNGTNVNFVERISASRVKIRTYERGVGETLACGTGAAAVAIISFLRGKQLGKKSITIRILTRSKDMLKVTFDRTNNEINNVWLSGSAGIIYNGLLAF